MLSRVIFLAIDDCQRKKCIWSLSCCGEKCCLQEHRGEFETLITWSGWEKTSLRCSQLMMLLWSENRGRNGAQKLFFFCHKFTRSSFLIIFVTGALLEERMWLKTKLVDLFSPKYVLCVYVAFLCNMVNEVHVLVNVCLFWKIQESLSKSKAGIKHRQTIRIPSQSLNQKA